MENFSNETIDTLNLPKYEDAELTPVHPSYIKVIYFNIALVFIIIAVLCGLAILYIEDTEQYWKQITIGYISLLIFTMFIQILRFRNRGFAFRAHDVIYKSGAISTTTTIIPYTRVQHVAEHEGVIARWLGLSSIEIFTAGGTGSDIKIPGLEKVHAISIKQLLVGKIENKNLNQTVDNESESKPEIEPQDEDRF